MGTVEARGLMRRNREPVRRDRNSSMRIMILMATVSFSSALVACGEDETGKDGETGTPCQSDIDCKGDRVCLTSGRCSDPSGAGGSLNREELCEAACEVIAYCKNSSSPQSCYDDCPAQTTELMRCVARTSATPSGCAESNLCFDGGDD